MTVALSRFKISLACSVFAEKHLYQPGRFQDQNPFPRFPSLQLDIPCQFKQEFHISQYIISYNKIKDVQYKFLCHQSPFSHPTTFTHHHLLYFIALCPEQKDQ